MKKKIILTLSIIGFLFSATPIFAEDLPDPVTLEVTADVLDTFDPLKVANSPHADTLSTPGGVITRVLQFVFPIAGLAMFVMIVAGGLQILSGAGNAKKYEDGRKRITMAIVGFLILFASYWIAQILEVIFGIAIL